MNYFSFHVGDFRSGTVNMSRQSRWIYRDMLDVYYDTEKPLTLDIDRLCDELGADSDEDRRIVERILRFKFVKTEHGYHHERCEKEIAEYRAKAETAKANGKRGGRPSKANINPEEPSGFPSGCESVASGIPVQTGSETNQEPRTINQEPKRESASADATPPKPEKRKSETQTLAAYLAHCKALGVKPVADDHSIRQWCADAGVVPEMLQVAWVLFRERYTEDEKGKGKRYKDWPGHFAKAVKAGWFKVWFTGGDGVVQWSSIGLTHKTVLDARMAQREAEHATA